MTNENIIIIKDITLERVSTSNERIAYYSNFIKSLDDSGAISVDMFREQINLHKVVYRRGDEKQEFVFGITDQAAERFPVLQLVKDLSDENEMLIQQNSNQYRHIEELKHEKKILEFALNSLRENKFVKFLRYMRLI